jgi:FkbM family methyltransferase
LKKTIKKLLKKIPFAFTLNQKYDVETKQVIARVCKASSNCIDIGCHKGEVLDMIIHHSPQGKHFGFEPIPNLFDALQEKYKGSNCTIFQIALSNTEAEASFNHVVSNPAYSGLVKRKYDRKYEIDESIVVRTARLDTLIPKDLHIDFIKIDVEGGELLVLEGAKETILRCQPLIIFEHGLGASEYYNSTPAKVYHLLHNCKLQISTMHHWLHKKEAFTLDEFERQFKEKINYYFIAYPSV